MWFWFSTRYNGAESYVPVFENLNAYKPNEWLYAPDHDAARRTKAQRSTEQPARDVAGVAEEQDRGHLQGRQVVQLSERTSAPPARRRPRATAASRACARSTLEWTSPVTNKLLFEAVGLHLFERWGNMHPTSSATARSTTRRWRHPAADDLRHRADHRPESTGHPATYNNTLVPNYAYRAALSYVTGTHASRRGSTARTASRRRETYTLNPVSYRFNNGVPNQITLRAIPRTFATSWTTTSASTRRIAGR